MTVFDAVLIAVVGVSVSFAAIRGAVREVATLAAVIIAGAGAWFATEPALALIGKERSFFAAIAGACLIGGALFVVAYWLMHKGLRRIEIGDNMRLADQVAGGLFGLARALALIGLGFLGYGYYLDEANQPDAVRKAALLPLAVASAGFFEQFAPETRELERSESGEAANAAAEGYRNSDRAGLEEIVTTVTTTESDDPIADIIEEEAGDDAADDRR